MYKRCLKCNSVNMYASNFCSRCGAKLRNPMKKYVIMEMSEDRLKEEISDVKLGFIIAVCLCVVFMIVSVIGSILDDIHLMIGFLICSIVALCAGCYCAYKYEILKRML